MLWGGRPRRLVVEELPNPSPVDRQIYDNMKTTDSDSDSDSAPQAGAALAARGGGLGRREFLRTSLKAGALGLACASGIDALGAGTAMPSNIRFFETPGSPATQWLFVSGRFTWSQAMRLSLSSAITDPYGPGWLLAQMLKPEDFVNAAKVIKLAMGDLRGKSGPFIGVVQAQGAPEPRDGFFNLDGSVPFVTWGKYDPNDGARVHRNILREQKFQEALRNISNEVINYYAGAGTADRFKPTIDFILNEVARPEGGRVKDDVVGLWHEKDGSVTAADVNAQTFYPALLARRKPQRPPATGPLPSWPRVNGRTDLYDGMRVARRSTLSWRWTGGARLGQLHIVEVRTGRTVIDRSSASTASQDLTILLPGTYLLRVRNISALTDPWLEIGFVIV